MEKLGKMSFSCTSLSQLATNAIQGSYTTNSFASDLNSHIGAISHALQLVRKPVASTVVESDRSKLEKGTAPGIEGTQFSAAHIQLICQVSEGLKLDEVDVAKRIVAVSRVLIYFVLRSMSRGAPGW